MPDWSSICAEVSAVTGKDFQLCGERSVGGGSINNAWIIESVDQSYFVKTNSPALLDMFAAEAEGLQELALANAIKVPAVVCYGVAGDVSYLVMEYVPAGGGSSKSHAMLGEQLASMHRHTSAEFGWHRDNTIGSTHQPNTQSTDWLQFLGEQRLGYQLELAARKGAARKLKQQGDTLLQELAYFFEGYQPEASLLHGDLWSGNYAFTLEGEPLIFDPAVYYGDREADIAMTELFGGFTHDFYKSYDESWPRDHGYKQRKQLYNLYHILNHFNLFGGGYEGQSISMLESLTRQLP